MKLLLTFVILLLVLVKSEISVNLYDAPYLITNKDYTFKVVAQIYNTDFLVVGDHSGSGTCNHKGYVGLVDLSQKKMLKWVNIKPDLGAGDEYWAELSSLANLPNSKYISGVVWWGRHGYYTECYVETWDTELNFISNINETASCLFFPAINGNTIMIPEGNILKFYNVITTTCYQSITSQKLLDIIWACETAHYYIIAIGTELELYDIQTLTFARATSLEQFTPIQVKPYIIMNSGTMIFSTYFYSSWQSGSGKWIQWINTEDFSYNNTYLGDSSSSDLLTCAPGNANTLELICANTTQISYIENLTIMAQTKPLEHFTFQDLFFTTNSSYYVISYYSAGYYYFYNDSSQQQYQ